MFIHPPIIPNPQQIADAINSAAEEVRIWKQQVTGLTNPTDQDFQFTTSNLAGDYRLKTGNGIAVDGSIFVEVYSDENRTTLIASNSHNRLQTGNRGEGDSDLLVENLSANTTYYLRFRAGGSTVNAEFIATIYYDQQQALV